MRATCTLSALAVALSPLAAPGSVAAQDDESAFVYASYYTCAGSPASAVTTLREDWAPMIQGRVDAGDIAAWGVLTHATGPAWSMAVYHIGEDRQTLNTALDETLSEYFEAHPEAAQRFNENCPHHEDYVWTTGPGSEPGAAVAQGRSSVGLSVYYVCDEGREAAADLIVEQAWAPLYDQQVAEGRLNSWGWLSHFLGGEYRRLLVTDGPSEEAVLEARDRIIEASAAENAAVGAVFSDICDGHQDVVWNIVESRP